VHTGGDVVFLYEGRLSGFKGDDEFLVHPLVVNAADGSVLVYVPAGEFEMGDGQDGNCPTHQVCLDAYYIGLYCVTNAQYGRFVREGQGRAPDNNRWKKSGLADHPVTDVSWDDAVAYGAWAGLRLPTEAEWEKAARGPAGWVYPWGNTWDATRCRHAGNRGAETTCRVDAYPGGVSGYGTYNQAGNVWECCADWYKDAYYTHSPQENPRGPKTGSDRVYRGCSWRYDHVPNFRGAYRSWDGPAFRDDLRGFRLVRAAS
jgi:formylglycine-generating enzyme required for sulfatase activity